MRPLPKIKISSCRYQPVADKQSLPLDVGYDAATMPFVISSKNLGGPADLNRRAF